MHERREIEDYLRSQSGPDFEIEHVEKLTSEYVLGDQYDVWDAHTNEGRWWVITNPTNLYSQDLIKSMDVALSFHIGLSMRLMAGESGVLTNRDRRARTLLRRLDVVNESLDRAKEVEDFQAVGMRLRELLLTLTFSLSELVQPPENTSDLQKAANFKALADIYARTLAGGKSSERLRSLLKSNAKEVWEYVSWLTHTRNANEQDARVALSAVNTVVEGFLNALTRVQRGKPERCPVCTSYRLTLVRSKDGESWAKLCEACGYTSAADAPHAETRSPESERDTDFEGDCVEIEDFGIYLTTTQARATMRNALGSPQEGNGNDSDDVEYQPTWANPFAYLLSKDARPFQEGVPIDGGALLDAHRLVFESFKHPLSPGSELSYRCGETACVNPDHAIEQPLSNELGWQAGVIKQVNFHPQFLELVVGVEGAGLHRLYIKSDLLDRYGFSDPSNLTERGVFITSPSTEGWVRLVPAARRIDYSQGSPVAGWLHPSNRVSRKSKCPCGSGKTYATCHGE